MNVIENPLSKYILINFSLNFNSQNILIVAYFQFSKLYFGILIWSGVIDDSIINNSAKCTPLITGDTDDLFFQHCFLKWFKSLFLKQL